MDLVPSSRSRRLPPCRSKEEKAMSFLCERFRRNKFFTEVSAKDGGSRGEDPPGRRSSFCTKGSTKDGGGNHGNRSGGSEDGSKGDPGVSTGQIIGGDGRGTEDDNDSMSGSDGSVSCSFSCSFSEGGKGILKAYEYKDRFDASASTNKPKDGGDDENRGGSSKDGNREDLKTSLGQIIDGENFEVCKDKDGFDTSTVTNNLADYLPTSLKDAHAKNAATTNSDNVSSSADGDTNSNSDKGRRKPQIARWLPWRDQRGVLGTYTGQINRFVRPHGCGTLIYEDGSAVTSIWEGGVPIKSWAPWEVKNSKKEPHKQRSRSGSSSNSTSSNNADIANGIAKKQQRQSSGRSSSSSSNIISSEDVEGSKGNRTFLPHLDLGDAGTPRDMIKPKSGGVALEILDSQLRTLDFAFVRRSDGRWTYAIVAEKCEDVVTLVVDGDGRTKAMSRRHWSGLIRLVNPREARRGRGGGDGGSSGSEGSNGSKREEEAVDGKGSPGRGPSQRSISI